MSLKLVFMGTPDFSVQVLKALIDAGHNIAAVYTQPPRKSGRGMKVHPSAVHKFALKHNLPVLTPTSLKGEQEQEALDYFRADAAVVVAYGLLLLREILNTPKHGCFNVHASLLPRWRGAAPIQRAIMAGDEKTGVSIMQMEAGLDTGPVCLTGEIAITPQTTAGSLHDELAELGARLMVESLEKLETGTLSFTPQPETGATYAKKIDKAEARIDFNQPVDRVLAHIHGLSPFPGAWFELPDGDQSLRIKLLQCQISSDSGTPGTIIDEQMTIACKDGAIKPVRLQRQGKGAMDIEAFLRGVTIVPGTQV